MLDDFVSNQASCPFRFVRRSSYGSIVITRASRAPSPNVAVSSVRSRLACIETAGVKETFVAVGPDAGIIGGSCFQLFQCTPLEILNFAYGCMHLRVDQIPPVSHLEDIGTFVKAIPHHGHEYTCMFPAFHIRRSIFGQHTFTAFGSGNKHVVFSIFTFKNEGIAEIILAVSVSVTFQIESAILGPGLEVG